MSDGAGSVERAREAASQGSWQEAFDLLVMADAGGLLGPAELPLLGEVAYAAGHLEVTLEAWERAHTAYLQSGDEVAAAGAAVRVAMHLLVDTALMAPIRGWLARAERLLDGTGESAVHAWFAVIRAYERILTGNLPSAREWAQRAVDLGEAWEPAAAAIGRVATARLLILGGEVEQGLALLDEAGVAAVSGDLDPLSRGIVFCELVCALQGAAQYDLAEQWTEAMELWCRTHTIGSINGRCRVHRAEILRLRGSYEEAEAEAVAACEELRPFLKRELGWPLSELGRIRLHRGDLAGAKEAFLSAHGSGWDPQPGLALVLLAQTDVPMAASSIRDALERPLWIPSKEQPPNTELQRAPLLEAQVEIGIAAGDVGRARWAADELERIGARFRSKALIAAATASQGRVRNAEGDAEGAEACFSEAARLWTEVGAPYEVARARIGLAEAHRARGNDISATLEREAAGAILKRIEGKRHRDAQGSGLVELRREDDHWSVLFDRHTVRVRDLKGMHYLERLISDPGREFHVLDLVALVNSGDQPRIAFGDAGEMLDAQAKAAYRRRLAEIEEDLEEARALGDAERAAQADAERDFLMRELSRAVGLGGRDRLAASASERARVSVTRAVRQAIARIAEHHPLLGAHLDETIRTGTYCAYSPTKV